MGAWMATQGLVPDWAVTSPAARARDTAHLVLPDADWREDERIYEASVQDLLTVLSEAPDGTERLLLVGHNPSLESLVRGLDPRAPPDRQMETCALARLELESPRLGAGRLVDVRCVQDL